MPDKRLEWLRKELQRTADRMHAEAQRLQQIQEEIHHIEREITPPPRRFDLIQGGGVASAAAVAVAWIRDHPTATVVTALVALGGILGLAASNPWSTPSRPPIALPAPSPTTISAPPAPPLASPVPPPVAAPPSPSGVPRPGAPITAQPITAPGRPASTTIPRQPAPPTTPPTTSPQQPPPAGSPPPGTPGTPPAPPPVSCGGVVYLALPPLAEVCLLG